MSITAFYSRLTPVQRWTLWGSLGAAAAVLLFKGRGAVSKAVDYGQETLFSLAIPAEAKPYALKILQVGRELSVDPFILAALGYRETHWGYAPGYVPKGNPRGTGDFGKRSSTATGLPPDGLGWGRGLMQIDYATWKDWLNSNPWWDPYTNIKKGAEIYKTNLAYFQAKGLTGNALIAAALAAYNAGPQRVYAAITAGRPPDSVTTGTNYSSSVIASAAKYLTNFAAG